MKMRGSGRRAGTAFFALIGACVFGGAAWSAGSGAIPDLSAQGAAWLNDYPDFLLPTSGAGPVTWDPAHPLFCPDKPGQFLSCRNPRVADLTNPILMPWVRQELQKFNEGGLAGKVQWTPISRCRPAGVPGALLLRRNPMFIAQTAKEVVFLYESDHQVRHAYLNVPHSARATPSWYGESVGHYEDDTLVVDTIGISSKTPTDYYLTPHTDKLHVVERYHVIDGGKTLEVDVTVDDPGAFIMPWSASQKYEKIDASKRAAPGERWNETVCAESESVAASRPEDPQTNLPPIPVATKPDF
jgi:hypothetical protein